MIGTAICILLMFVVYMFTLVLLLDAQKEQNLLRIEVDFLRTVNEKLKGDQNRLIDKLIKERTNSGGLTNAGFLGKAE